MRVPHVVPRNKSSAQPQRIVFLDTETTPTQLPNGYTEHRLRLGAALYWQREGARQPEREEWRDFHSAAEWWAWVERHTSRGRRLVILAHNAGFDLQVLGGPAALAARGWTVTKAIIDSYRMIIRAERDDRSLLIIDMANYVRAPLARIGESIAVPKWPMPDMAAPDDVWAAYCRQDVRVLAAAFRRYLSLTHELDLGHFGETLAKQVMNGYRHRLMRHAIVVHALDDVTARERAAYFGGRCEAYLIGRATHGPYAKLDINSAFAAVMRSELYPWRLRYSTHRLTPDTLAMALRRYLAVAEVEIETDEPVYPVRHDGRLVFPIGSFRTSLATPELWHALARRRVRAVGLASLYDGFPLFKVAVDELYRERVAAKRAGRSFEAGLIKSMLVSLYGRFGMRVTRWGHVGDEPELPDERFDEYSMDERTLHEYRRIGGRVEIKNREEDAPETFVAIPAHVTSHARIMLWRYMVRAGRDHVLYCDTDSLIVDEAGRRALAPYIDAEELGRLKIEDESMELVIGGQKVYRLGDELRQKGRSARADDLGAFAFGQTEFASLNEAMRLRHIGGALSRYVERAAPSVYRVGTVAPDGRVTPIVLGRPDAHAAEVEAEHRPDDEVEPLGDRAAGDG